MAKKSKVVKNNKRIAKVAQYAAKRLELKETIRSPKTSYEDRELAAQALRKLPRDSSATRIRNRCMLTGRPRGVYSKFGLCRIKIRERGMAGELPGVTKASW